MPCLQYDRKEPNMSGKTPRRALSIFVMLAILLSLVPAASPTNALAGTTAQPLTEKAIFFGADGMRPDLMERYASMGLMPAYADLLAKGVRGDNGLVQAFPPNTGVGWYTLATGTYPGEHGSTNKTLHRPREGKLHNR